MKMSAVPNQSRPSSSPTSGALVAGITAPPAVHSVGPDDRERLLESLGWGYPAWPSATTQWCRGIVAPAGESGQGVRTALDRSGAHVASVAAGLSSPVFRHGALAANRPEVRRLALRRVLDAVDLAAELAAPLHVLDLRHEPAGRGLEQDVAAALDRYAEAVNPAAFTWPTGKTRSRWTSPVVGFVAASMATRSLPHARPPELVGLPRRFDRHGGVGPFLQEAAQALWPTSCSTWPLGSGRVVASASGAGRRDALLLVDPSSTPE